MNNNAAADWHKIREMFREYDFYVKRNVKMLFQGIVSLLLSVSVSFFSIKSPFKDLIVGGLVILAVLFIGYGFIFGVLARHRRDRMRKKVLSEEQFSASEIAWLTKWYKRYRGWLEKGGV